MQFGIVTDEVFIPFETDGTTIYFDSFTPTMQDIETHPHLVLTNEMEWDPHNINMQRKPDKWLEQNAAFLNAVSRVPRNYDPHSDIDLLTREIKCLSMSEHTWLREQSRV